MMGTAQLKMLPDHTMFMVSIRQPFCIDSALAGQLEWRIKMAVLRVSFIVQKRKWIVITGADSSSKPLVIS